MPGILYVVATPIGNLEDISGRALRVLNEVNLIAAEDTQHSQKLLKHYAIKTPLISLHQFNEKSRTEKIIAELHAGKSIALISDAGTPLINDPGYHLVNALHQEGFQVVPIPGVCAAITALSVSGLPTDQFLFVGFLPPKKNAQLKKLSELKNFPFTLVFYEAPHRVLMLLENLLEILGSERQLVIARELTKTYETILPGKIGEIVEYFREHSENIRGEFVVLVEGNKGKTNTDIQNIETTLKVLLAELPLNQAVKIASKITAMRRNKIYEMALGFAEKYK